MRMGFWEWVIVMALAFILLRRASARNVGRAVGRATGDGPPPAPKLAQKSALSECYVVLEVPESASTEQIRESYKNLVKVWHPDRFPNDPKLRDKADSKLKDINAAYERVMAARK